MRCSWSYETAFARPTCLAELRRLLDMCRAAKLGFVLTGTLEGRSAYDYGDTGSSPIISRP